VMQRSKPPTSKSIGCSFDNLCDCYDVRFRDKLCVLF
jgi:hypothetical protein